MGWKEVVNVGFGIIVDEIINKIPNINEMTNEMTN